jgi:hypothetical protein
MIYTGLKYQVETPLDYQYTLLKNEGQGEKYFFSRCRYQWEVSGPKDRENGGEYGECVPYPYMKTED